MTVSKAEIRGLVRGLADRSDDAELLSRFLSLHEYKSAGTVFFYLGVGTEIDTRPLIADALASGKRVALPRITGPGAMEARQISSLSELVPGKFGIPEPPEGSRRFEPCDLDLILVPGAAFTRGGARLGRGGGYYDRYLSKASCPKVALARRGQLFQALPTEDHDIDVDIVITAT